MLNFIELAEKCFVSRSGPLCGSEIRPTSLADAYGTPLFVYDRGNLEIRLNQLRAILTPLGSSTLRSERNS
jgi:hypothetical protein